MQVSGSQAARLQLAVGQVRTLSEPSSLACVRLSNAEYLVVVQNTAPRADSLLSLQVLGLTDVITVPGSATVASARHHQTFDVQSQFQAKLRAYEKIAPRMGPLLKALPRSAPLQVGDVRKFNAGGWFRDNVEVTAQLRVISQRALSGSTYQLTHGRGRDDIETALPSERTNSPSICRRMLHA